MPKDLVYNFEEIVGSLDAYVYHYSFAEALLLKVTGNRALVVTDFRHYCIAKGVKHFKASLLLIEHGFGEDALVLIRSAYEAYLSLCFSIQEPERAVDHFVYDKIALNADRAAYAKTKKGKADYRRIVDLETGFISEAPPSLEKIVPYIGNRLDIELHRPIYSFLSEHSHVHMMGSGNYRKGTKYVTDSDSQVRNATTFGLHFSLLLLDICLSIEDIDSDERIRCESEITAASESLSRFVGGSSFEGNIQSLLLARIACLLEKYE